MKTDGTTSELLASLKAGDTIHVLQRHVSRSGMQRHLSLFVVKGDRLIDVTHAAALVMGERVHDTHGGWTIKVNGCGMDMHFATVYSLSRSLFPKGHKCTGERRCPSNDHSNDWNRLANEYDKAHAPLSGVMAADYVADRSGWIAVQDTHSKRRVHADGGYALGYRSI